MKSIVLGSVFIPRQQIREMSMELMASKLIWILGSSPGRLYTGRGNGLQSDDRSVMRQRTGASVFFERIREGAWFRSIVFVRLLLRFYEKFQEILNLKFKNDVSFNV